MGPKYPKSTAIIGSIGKDEYGKKFINELEEEGIQRLLYIDKTVKTNLDVVLETDENTCLIRNVNDSPTCPESFFTVKRVSISSIIE